MTHRQRSLGRSCRLLVAALAVSLLPGMARAESLVFRNDCNAPVILQASSVFRGVLWRGKPCLLKPKDRSPAISMPGVKVITIYDAKVANRVLFQGTVPPGIVNLYFSILPDAPPPRVRVQRSRPMMP